jgi:hypothetical protein
MSFRELWDFRQDLKAPVVLADIRRKLRELTGRGVVVHRVDADPDFFYGMYLSPRNEDTLYHKVPAGAGAIVICKHLDPAWQRFVELKELMHLFDDPMQSTTTGEEFEALLTGLCEDLRGGNRSPQHQSELDSIWMAISLICPEEMRTDFIQQRSAGKISDKEFADKVEMPEVWIPGLNNENYKAYVEYLWKEA